MQKPRGTGRRLTRCCRTSHEHGRACRLDDTDAEDFAGLGDFVVGTHTHASLTRRYKLYIPPGHVGRKLPLVVMLHGCTQDPDAFAIGTGMNERACEQGFFVLYPAQSQDANPSRCWNWFKHNHQRRDSGEPALLAAMTQAVISRYGIDPHRVYVAGLSAGGAMAAILAAAYPEIYAAVGVHSGLPHGAASNLSEALAVMKSGVGAAGVRGQGSPCRPEINSGSTACEAGAHDRIPRRPRPDGPSAQWRGGDLGCAAQRPRSGASAHVA